MPAEIHALPAPAPPEPREDVVSVLEEFLEAARAGKLRAVALVGVDVDDSVWLARAGQSRRFTFLGAIEALKQRFAAQINNDDD